VSEHRDHHHGHHHAHTARESPAFIAALSITFAYALIETAGGLWSGSLALLGDAGHMFSDVLALAVAAAAAWLARRPAGLTHTYGWARAEVLGALLNGLIMLVIVVVLTKEAVERFLMPRPVLAGGVIVIALVGLAVNGLVAYMLSRSSHDLNARAAMVHVLGDLASSVAALIAGIVIYATGWLAIDPILSVVISALILLTTVRLLRDTVRVLMEAVPAAIDVSEIGKTLAAVVGVASVHDLHVWTIGHERVALSAHIEVDRLAEWPRILADSRQVMHARYGIDHVTLQPEEPVGAAAVTFFPRKGQSS
jgi:cobalt-zinc-cadmium efflux system protein